MGIGNGPSIPEAKDRARGGEPGEGLAEALVADVDTSAKLVPCDGGTGLGQGGEHERVEGEAAADAPPTASP